MSEEFGGRLPSEILAEVNRLPAGMLEQIIEYRAMARAIAEYEANPKARGGYIDDVIALEFEAKQREIDQ